jgi:hypothetical protein
LDGTQVNTYIVAKYEFGNSTNAFGLGTAQNSNAYAFLKGDPISYQDTQGGPSLADGNWHFLAMVYDNQNGLSLYVDGGLAGGFPNHDYGPFADDTPLLIGKTFSGQFFGGAIDEVRIYNRPLTATEVADMGPPPIVNVTLQPRGGYTIVGNSITLRSSATVSPSIPLDYQWFLNDQPVPDATNQTIRITRDTAGIDRYKLRFTASPTVVFSDEATVEFGPQATAALIAHYSFETGGDGAAIDDTGNFSGEAVNTEIVPGRLGARALRFNGTNSYVHIPFPASPLDLAGTPYTIAFWMKPEPKGPQSVIWMGDNTNNQGGYAFNLTSTSASWAHNSGADSSMPTFFRATSNWVHVAMVWNGIQRTLYMNGVISNKVATTNAIISERDDDLYFGSLNGTNSFFKGALDDIRIYNYALASDEIQQLSSAQNSTSVVIAQQSTGLLLKWPYDPNADFRLEYATELAPGVQWTPASGVPQRTGDVYSLAQPFDSTIKYFRLRKL